MLQRQIEHRARHRARIMRVELGEEAARTTGELFVEQAGAHHGGEFIEADRLALCAAEPMQQL